MRKFIYFFIIICLTGHCAKIKIKNHTTISEFKNNWKLYGGNINRSNESSGELSFPLELKWQYRPTCAIGKTLLAVNGIVYFNTLDGRVYALNITSGKKIGYRKMEFESTSAYSNSFMFIARRYGDDTLYKYNIENGKLEWKINAGDVASEPLIFDNSIAITALYNHIDLYNIENGESLWQFETKGQIHSSPASNGKIIVFGCDDRNVYAVNKGNGELIWKFQTNGSVLATPVIKNDIVYVGSCDKTFYALNIVDGKLVWKFDTRGQITDAAAVNDNYIILGSADSQLYCLDRKTGLQIWVFETKGVISTCPVICKNNVIFGSYDQHYYAVDIKFGRELWKFKTKGRIKTAPVIWGDYLIGASENNYVYAFSAIEDKELYLQ